MKMKEIEVIGEAISPALDTAIAQARADATANAREGEFEYTVTIVRQADDTTARHNFIDAVGEAVTVARQHGVALSTIQADFDGLLSIL